MTELITKINIPLFLTIFEMERVSWYPGKWLKGWFKKVGFQEAKLSPEEVDKWRRTLWDLERSFERFLDEVIGIIDRAPPRAKWEVSRLFELLKSCRTRFSAAYPRDRSDIMEEAGRVIGDIYYDLFEALKELRK